MELEKWWNNPYLEKQYELSTVLKKGININRETNKLNCLKKYNTLIQSHKGQDLYEYSQSCNLSFFFAKNCGWKRNLKLTIIVVVLLWLSSLGTTGRISTCQDTHPLVRETTNTVSLKSFERFWTPAPRYYHQYSYRPKISCCPISSKVVRLNHNGHLNK